MEVFNSIKSTDGTKDLISVRAYKGDAMTLLCFDVDKSLTAGLAGFAIKFSCNKSNRFIFNRMTFSDAFLANNPQIPKSGKNSSEFAPIQRFGWIHVPSGGDNDTPFFGKYTYFVTPRYIENGKLKDLDSSKTVSVKIDVSPFDLKKTQVAFTRGFASSTAYVKRFGLKNKKVRPNETDLLFDITQTAAITDRWSNATHSMQPTAYSFEEQHKWLGWQARQRVLDFLDAAVNDTNTVLKVFAFDLDEPEICKRLLKLAKEDRLKIILDNSKDHNKPTSFETLFDTAFKKATTNHDLIQRGNFNALAHSKIFIQVKNGVAVKVLTGSTNFSTNGLYVNANHVLVFDNNKIAKLYEDVFEASFGDAKMNSFKGLQFSTTDFDFNQSGLPKFSVTFAPHPKADAQRIFDRISQRIESAESDVFFAVMKDTSGSSILDAIQKMVRSDSVYTYGITDTISKKDTDYGVFLYKPNSKRGIRIAAKGISSILPPPFGEVPKIDGFAIHHKFVVVDFKGKNPVVYCGSSNLAFGPEQANGDNLLEIHDKDIVTAFAIEADRLVDHYQWRNKELKQNKMELDDLTTISDKTWYKKYYNPNDLRFVERKKFIAE